jgi:DNA-directed RNA polymerase subunit RPC12/RpoP
MGAASGIADLHVWWVAKCSECHKRVRVAYAGELESHYLSASKPALTQATCSHCGHREAYGESDLEQRFGPAPRSRKRHPTAGHRKRLGA